MALFTKTDNQSLIQGTYILEAENLLPCHVLHANTHTHVHAHNIHKINVTKLFLKIHLGQLL